MLNLFQHLELTYLSCHAELVSASRNPTSIFFFQYLFPNGTLKQVQGDEVGDVTDSTPQSPPGVPHQHLLSPHHPQPQYRPVCPHPE